MFSTEGRLNRLKFFIYSVCWGFGVSLVGALLLAAVSGDRNANAVMTIVIHVVFAIGMFMLSVRRFHDLNTAGGWSCLGFVPLVNLFLFLYLIFAKGTDGSNKYGERQ